jgi:hypothetical protein
MHRAAVKHIFIYAGAAALVVMAACGPPGPALGLGPVLDPFVGFGLLLALLLGGGWVVRSAARSPDGQAIERRISETSAILARSTFSAASKAATPPRRRGTSSRNVMRAERLIAISTFKSQGPGRPALVHGCGREAYRLSTALPRLLQVRSKIGLDLCYRDLPPDAVNELRSGGA